MLNEAQKELIRRAYATAAKSGNETVKQNRLDTLAKQFAEYGVTPGEVKAIATGVTNPISPVLERHTPVKWTDAMVRTLKNMLNDGRKPAEIAKLMHLERTQGVTKINALKKEAGQAKKSVPMPVEPASTPATKPTPQVEPVPTFDLTALDKPIDEHFDVFETLQNIMQQFGAGYVSMNVTQQDGTKYRAEVRK